MSDVATTTYEIVIGIADPGHAAVVERIIDKHARVATGFTASNAMMTFDAVRQFRPPLVLFADDSPGVRGTEVVRDMFQASPDTIIIMLATGSDAAYLRVYEEVFQAVTIMNPSGIKDALDSALEYLDNPEAAETADGPSRRKHDRRLQQDWSQVFAERREDGRRT
jgi:DNA-binding NarL/FixJ family response regulator